MGSPHQERNPQTPPSTFLVGIGTVKRIGTVYNARDSEQASAGSDTFGLGAPVTNTGVEVVA